MRARQRVIWLLLLLLLAAIVILENSDWATPKIPLDRHGHGRSEVRMLVPAPVAELGALEIVHNASSHRFERDQAGLWRYRNRLAENADGGAQRADLDLAQRIEDSLAVFARTRIERQFPLNMNVKDYGVIKPAVSIVLYRRGVERPLMKYAVGDIAPDTVSRYVMIVGSFVVVTIPNYQIENLLALLAAVDVGSARL